MRIDTGHAPEPGDTQDPLTRLRGAAAALRRRWYLVLIPLVVGAGLGWFSAPESITVNSSGVPAATVNYYRASHVLVAEPPTTGAFSEEEPESLELNRAAYLVNTGEVPTMVAEELGISVEDARQSLLGLPREQVTSVEVQAFATNRDRAEALADSAASSLQTVLRDQATDDANAKLLALQAQLDEIDGEINALNAQIIGDPPNRPQLEAERSTLTDQYGALLQRQADFENAPESAAGLRTLQEAQATKISKADYENAKKVIREGADYVTGAPVTAPEEEGSGSSGPSVGASRSTRAGLGGILGLAAGVGLVLLLDRFDGRLRRRDQVEAVTGFAVVSEIPPLSRTQQQEREVVAHHQHRSRAAEAYRVLRGALLYVMANPEAADGPHPNGQANGSRTAERPSVTAERETATVVMVTSAEPVEGKTTTVANLASVLAEGGLRVLVVNCDFRRPLIGRYLLHDGVDHPDGPDAGERTLVRDTEIEGVKLVTGISDGDPDANPLEVVARQRKVIEMAGPHFDVILLDTAPFLTTNDASELFDLIDHLVLVVRAGRTTVAAAHRAAETLERFAVPVLGVVMNDSDESPVASYYYDGYTTRRRRTRKHHRHQDDADSSTPDLQPTAGS